MATIFDIVKLSYGEYYNATKDPEIDTWPLMDNSLPVISILSVYLLIVLKIGPKIMDQRKPYSLRSTLVIYNFAMVIVSVILTLWITGAFQERFNKAPPRKATLLDWERRALALGSVKDRPRSERKKTREETCAGVIASIEQSPIKSTLVTKCISFLYQDGCHPTQELSKMNYKVFFILRKKYNQVSFLHVYHHSSTLLYSWIHLKYLPGLQGIIMGFLNSGVHIIMYFYYMLSAMGPAYQKYLWWKKYITIIQMVQFILMMTYMTGTLVFSCDLPKIVSIYFNLISIIFLLLFINFYNRAYTKKSI
ncbi:Elongation of very long chain fatty acids protein 7 [Blattella germanica]|nr:Elongation of very long chain fatty acids protein 7 [Blattella germanica]